MRTLCPTAVGCDDVELIAVVSSHAVAIGWNLKVWRRSEAQGTVGGEAEHAFIFGRTQGKGDAAIGVGCCGCVNHARGVLRDADRGRAGEHRGTGVNSVGLTVAV